MRILIALVLFMSSIVMPFAAQAKTSSNAHFPPDENIPSDISQLKRDTKAITDEIGILRRDQINYRIEKDLLKETYASNLQGINITITIVLAVITVVGTILGYFGLRSLKELKAEYAKDLEALRALKMSQEREFDEFRKKQMTVETQVDGLAKTNEEQDQRLKILEISEKAIQHFQNNNFDWALQYANAGLAIKPEDETMLKIRAGSLGKKGDFYPMIEALKKVLDLKPDDISTITNLSEALALSGRYAEFQLVIEKYKSTVETERPGLGSYLRIIAEVMGGTVARAKETAKPFVESFPSGAATRLGKWEFDELRMAISKLTDMPTKQFVESFLQFLIGGLSKEAMLALIAA